MPKLGDKQQPSICQYYSCHSLLWNNLLSSYTKTENCSIKTNILCVSLFCSVNIFYSFICLPEKSPNIYLSISQKLTNHRRENNFNISFVLSCSSAIIRTRKTLLRRDSPRIWNTYQKQDIFLINTINQMIKMMWTNERDPLAKVPHLKQTFSLHF